MKNFVIILCCLIVTPIFSQCSWYAYASPSGVCGPNTIMVDVEIAALGSSATAWSLYIQTDEFITQDVLHYDQYGEGEYRIYVDVPDYVINSQSNIYALFSDAPSPGMGFCQEDAISLGLSCLQNYEACGGPEWGDIVDIQPES